MARIPEYDNDTKVRLAPNGESTLKKFSDRRAIVNHLVDVGGVTTIGEISVHFGFDFRDAVVSLIRSGWLEVME